MKMNKQATRFWTFDTLVGAFLDLFISYVLLCASTVALFAVNFLRIFGLSLPNSNNGFLGIQTSDYRSLLVDYPIDKISSVQFSATRKFPFDSIFFGVHNRYPKEDLNPIRGDDFGDLFMELEGEASCSSKSDARKLAGNEIDDSGVMIEKERGLDLKGKEGLNYRFRSGKHSSVSSSSNWVTCVDQQSNDGEEHSGRPGGTCFYSDVNNVSEANDAQKQIPVNEADKDKMIDLLTRELEELQAARASLYVELEKERNAAASAADEAMSMIFRLQEEKASTKMELSQYKRMIEEKSAYDAEEMNILKEIVLRREREKHFLEKQVEAYRQMMRVENDQDFGFLEDVEFSKIEEKDKEINLDDASRAHDIHVIDNEPKSSEKTNENKSQIDQKHIGTEMSIEIPAESFTSSLRRNSTSALDNERTRLDTEVEWLRERLRIVQEGRGKLKFSVENREKESLQLELLEDIARQLQEIRMLTEPQKTRQASLPLPSSKVGVTKRRRCTSVSSELANSS